METNFIGKVSCVLALAVAAGFCPLYGADERGPRIDINLVIDGSAALADVLDDVTNWISGNLVEKQLREGDRISIWSAGEKAEMVYSDTLVDNAGKENIKKALAGLSSGGDSADFAGALRAAAARVPNQDNITCTLLVSASSAVLSPTLMGPDANLMRFSRVEEFSRWRALIIALNIDSRVRRAAAAYFSGSQGDAD
jgi:hypothetical protein